MLSSSSPMAVITRRAARFCWREIRLVTPSMIVTRAASCDGRRRRLRDHWSGVRLRSPAPRLSDGGPSAGARRFRCRGAGVASFSQRCPVQTANRSAHWEHVGGMASGGARDAGVRCWPEGTAGVTESGRQTTSRKSSNSALCDLSFAYASNGSAQFQAAFSSVLQEASPPIPTRGSTDWCTPLATWYRRP